jgi:rhodanese-related sulfurtransferase
MTAGASPDQHEIEADEAIALVRAGAYLLDVRERHEWDAGHSPAAHSLPMSAIQDRVEEIPDDRDVYVVCHSGARSARVTQYLLSLDIRAVNVAGGMLAWHAAGGEVVASPES